MHLKYVCVHAAAEGTAITLFSSHFTTTFPDRVLEYDALYKGTPIRDLNDNILNLHRTTCTHN